jgi:hypothetical protein
LHQVIVRGIERPDIFADYIALQRGEDLLQSELALREKIIGARDLER